MHGAELKDGKRVVIKVQHLGMEVVMNSDLRNIVWVSLLQICEFDQASTCCESIGPFQRLLSKWQ